MDIRHICRLFSHCCHPLICWFGVVGLIVGLGLLRLPLRLSSRVRVVRSQQWKTEENIEDELIDAIISALAYLWIHISTARRLCSSSPPPPPPLEQTHETMETPNVESVGRPVYGMSLKQNSSTFFATNREM